MNRISAHRALAILAALVVQALALAPAAHAADGALDPSFGTSGFAVTAVGAYGDGATAVTVQPDGKLVAVGETSSGTSYDYAVLRYDADGALDTSFGGDGKVTLDVGGAGRDDYAEGVALQPDGKIVVVGRSSLTGGQRLSVVRLAGDGSLDASFGSGGKVLTDVHGDASEAAAVTVQPDGKIVVAGSAHGPDSPSLYQQHDFAVVRYASDGTLDPGFSADGVQITDVRGFKTHDRAESVHVQPDGKIVLVGSASDSAYTRSVALARYDADGSLDGTFGVGGVRVDAEGQAHDSVLLPDGLIAVAADLTTAAGLQPTVLRYTAAGSRDATFATEGAATVPVAADPDRAEVAALVAQADGALVLVGHVYDSEPAPWDPTFTTVVGSDPFAARLRADGTLDATYGENGVRRADDGAFQAGADAALQPDGALVVAGRTSRDGTDDFELVRLTGSLPEPPVNTSPPTVSGAARVGETLTGTQGAWTGTAPVTYALQWQRCAPGCTDIPAATQPTYELVAADVGATVRLAVTADNAAPGTVTAHSGATAEVVPPDTAAPETTLAHHPSAHTRETHATFAFSATEAGATFKCRLDSAPAAPCSSPHVVDVPAEGEHRFQVVAEDGAGNVDATPAEVAWVLDRTAPAAPELTAGPSPGAPTQSRDAAFAFGFETGAQAQCREDDGPWTTCTSPRLLSGLAIGEHAFAVRAVDAAGNASEVTERRWRVAEAAAPEPGPSTPAASAPATTPPAGTPARPPATTPPALRAVVGEQRRDGAVEAASRITVEADRTVAVGCEMSGARLERCVVDVFAALPAASRRASAAAPRQVLIGHGTAGERGGPRGATVRVKLNARGRRLLARSPRGLRVRVAITATPLGATTRLRSTGSATLFARTTRLVAPSAMFDPDSAALLPSARRWLRHAAPTLANARTVTCEGHAANPDDAHGGPVLAARLGRERARTVCAFLRRQGVEGSLRVRSFGDTRPRAGNATRVGREGNRRVELVVSR